jgi:hypothetical protein
MAAADHAWAAPSDARIACPSPAWRSSGSAPWSAQAAWRSGCPLGPMVAVVLVENGLHSVGEGVGGTDR